MSVVRTLIVSVTCVTPGISEVVCVCVCVCSCVSECVGETSRGGTALHQFPQATQELERAESSVQVGVTCV